MNNLKDLLKNASLEDLQSLVQQKKIELKKQETKNDFFKKVFEIRNFLKTKNLSLNDFQKMKSFFKKSKKAAKSNTSNNIGSVEILEGKIINITPSEKKGIFNGLLKSENLNKKVRFYGKKLNYDGISDNLEISDKILDCYNFIR